MITLTKQRTKLLSAEILLDDEGGVRVRTGPAGRLREIHTPASKLNGTQAEFRDSKVALLMRDGYHVVTAEHVPQSSVFHFKAPCGPAALSVFRSFLQEKGLPTDTGVVELHTGTDPDSGVLRGTSVGGYGWQLALAVAVSCGTQTVIKDGDGLDVSFKDVLASVVPSAELTEQALEMLYTNGVLPRPLQIGTFGARRHHARIAI